MSPLLETLAGDATRAYGLFSPAVTGNYYSIQTVTLTTSSSAVNFSAIPQTYTRLQLRCLMQAGSTSVTVTNQVGNGSLDTGSNYAWHTLYGTGSAAGTAAVTSTGNFVGIDIYGTGSYFAGSIYDFVDYSNTNKYKTIRVVGGGDNNSNNDVAIRSAVWMNTAAITNIGFAVSGNFNAGSTFALYGVK